MSKKSFIEQLRKEKKARFFIGFDGFKDTIIHCVEKRVAPDQIIPVASIGAFAKTIEQAQGKSINIECIIKEKKLGGNAPILAYALVLGSFQNQVSLIAAMGEETIDPLFLPLKTTCSTVHSIAAPGETNAFEFQDGKLLFGTMESILSITPQTLLTKVGEKELSQLLEEADLIATVNWTMLPHMNAIWEFLYTEIFTKIDVEKKWFFVDFADPAKREDKELLEAIKILQKIQQKILVCIGLNERESERLCLLYEKKDFYEKISDRAQFLQTATGLHTIVIHTKKNAALAQKDRVTLVSGPYTEKPLRTTGAGDNFNAGLCQALSLNLSDEEALILAMATAGFYIRTGKSPSRKELIDFIENHSFPFENS